MPSDEDLWVVDVKILSLNIECRRVASFTLRQLYPLGKNYLLGRLNGPPEPI